MTVVAVIFFPVVLVYQGWSYHVFRARLSAPRAGGAVPPVDGSKSPAPDSTPGTSTAVGP
jgi:hypothetical protein